ncbi:hypothetical protein N0V90_010329 [Kalmusia sp. IMI 367209]|nr:hypothetical protein N0V90_010329 [Kalmusia sp. IMI 367209]
MAMLGLALSISNFNDDQRDVQVEPKVFKAYLHWLKHATIPRPSNGPDQNDYPFLAKLYVLGERVGDVRFKNAMIDTIIAVSVKARWCPVGEPVSIIYDGTKASSPARRLMTDFCAHNAGNDVLNYIGPTLEKHKGCDLLDLNPGVGLWSQKIHNFLQPRSHVLLESTPSLYQEYLQPLLDEPGSTYKLVEGDIGYKKTFTTLFNNDLFPHQKHVEPESLEAQQPNDTLLVIGQLMWNPKAPGWSFDSLARQLLMLFSQSAWSNEGFHKHGLVRSLLWMTDDESKPCLPRSHYMFNKYTVYMNFLTRNVQVVTPPHQPRLAGHGTIARDAQYEIQSVMRAMRRGRDRGIEFPSHRRGAIHDFAEDIEQRKGLDGRLSTPEMQKYLEEQQRAGKSTVGLAFESIIDIINQTIALEKDPTMYDIPKDQRTGKFPQKRTEAGQKFSSRKASTAQAMRGKVAMGESAEVVEAVYDQECKVLSMEEGPDKEAALQDLEALNDKLEASLSKLAPFRRSGAISEGNERISLKSPVPRLEWDNRPYEPLIMQEDEVWPSQRVSLIDTEPRPLPPGEKHVYFEWIMDFVYALYQLPTQSVKKTLETMQPGASEIIEQAPSLKDPKKGGRLNMDLLRVNMLTTEMVAELCVAYKNWPFRNQAASHTRYFQMKVKGP